MSAEPGAVPRMRTRRGNGPVVLARVLSVLALAGFVAGCSGSGAGQSVEQWWSDHGQHLMERANQDVGQISSDSQYDPASLPADGRQLMSDVRAAQADPPPQDKPDYRTYLSGLAKTALTNESGNSDGPLTVTSYQDAEQTRQALDRFGNMLACHHIALDGDMGTCTTPGSGGNGTAPAEAPSSADTPAGEQPSPADTPAGESPSPADASGDEEQAQADLRAVREISFSAGLAALSADARTSVNDGRKTQADFRAYKTTCVATNDSAPEADSLLAAFENDEAKMFYYLATPASDDTRATNDATRLQQAISAAGSQVTALQDDMATLQGENAAVPSGAPAAITAAQNAISQAVSTANADIDQVNQADNQVGKLQGTPICPLALAGQMSYLPGPGIPHITS